MFIPAYFTLAGCDVKYTSEKGDYILYNRGGLLSAPHVKLGVKSGLFITGVNYFQWDMRLFPMMIGISITQPAVLNCSQNITMLISYMSAQPTVACIMRIEPLSTIVLTACIMNYIPRR